MLRCACFAVVAVAGSIAGADTFTIVVLPDTQNYVNNALNAPLFTQQTQWIVDQVQMTGSPDDIVFVTHVGDVVSTGTNLTQFNRADTSLDVLDGAIPESVVPWSVLPGNHDFAVTGDKSTGTDNYVAFFGPSRFMGKSWFGGGDPSGNNTYQFFQGGGVTYMHIALEWQPTVNITNGPTRDPSPIEWAQQVIRDNPGIPTIVSTHEHLDDSPAGRSPSGQALWNELILQNDQIIMVLGGHHHGAGGTNDGEYHQVANNAFGKIVIEALQDYQDYPNGGDGWLRYITFDTNANTIDFFTYSPVLDMFQDETTGQVGQFASRFTIPFDFTARFDFEPPPAAPIEVFEDVTFRESENGYVGTLDKEIRSSGGDAGNGDATLISVDGDDSGAAGLQPNHVLVRFDNVIGAGAGQIDPSEDIHSARLELGITNPGSGMTMYQMTAAWDETTTWVALGGNGVTPGVETLATPLGSVGGNDGNENVGAGLLSLDITPAFEDWQNGAANLGVGLVPFINGTNGIDFSSSEGGAPPALVVRRVLPGFGASGFRQGDSGYTGVIDTQLRQGEPATNFGGATTLTIDSDDPVGQTNHVLIRFDDIFEPNGPVPTTSVIARAFLDVEGTDAGDGATVHRMLQTWDTSATWSNVFGGDGVQANNVEAVAVADAVAFGGTGRIEIDVTASLRAWQGDPSTNHGWALLPLGTDGWDLSSSDAPDASRPVLTVVLDTSCVADVTTQGAGAGDPGFGVPDGQVTTADIQFYVNLFIAMDPGADLTTQGAGAGDPGFGVPDGQVTVADINFYVNSFVAGCP